MNTSNYQVVWQGLVHDSQGYARASREYLLALDRAGVDVKVEPLNFGTPSVQIDAGQAKRIQELIDKPYAPDKKKILIYHSQPYGINPIEAREKFDYVIINTVWETTKIPAQWFPSINQADAVIVPSTQNVDALRNSGVTVPIFLVPHGADVKTYSPLNSPLALLDTKDKFTFLSVFQWQHRKAPDVLLKAFWSEFNKQDKVAMVIKTFWGNSAIKADQMAILEHITHYKNSLGFRDTADIFITPSVFSDEDMKSLYRIADIFVLPSRGEGVGLPYIEALSSGIPAIATGWGGQTDFLNDQNSYLVDYRLTPATETVDQGVAPNFYHLFTKDMQWAEPSVESLREQMRTAYENQLEVKAKGRQGRVDMENMSWDKSGEFLKACLEGLE